VPAYDRANGRRIVEGIQYRKEALARPEESPARSLQDQLIDEDASARAH
jgi:hypothetical protein